MTVCCAFRGGGGSFEHVFGGQGLGVSLGATP